LGLLKQVQGNPVILNNKGVKGYAGN